MRESIGSVALYNIILIFIVVTFAVLCATMSYSKAFKVNNRIINALEKCEGYNECSSEMIDRQLSSIGYQARAYNSGLCRQRDGYTAMKVINPDSYGSYNPNYELCIYEFDSVSSDSFEFSDRYKQYGVVSYIYIDFFGLSDLIRVPVYGVSNKVFHFNKSNN